MTLAGYPSKVSEAWVNGKTWFRVQHGEYKMIVVAKQISNKIKNKFKFDPWISNIYKKLYIKHLQYPPSFSKI